MGSILDVSGVRVGHAHDEKARTGCTVVLMPKRGAVCGVDVRGSAPGTRETDLLAPTAHIEVVHAIVLTGGSAFGLDAAGGVMRYLEERGIGHEVGPWCVPIVPAAVIFDLGVGDGSVRPDTAMGRAACEAARSDSIKEGSVGVGCGATAGKLAGLERAMRSGIGTAARRHGEIVVGALAVANAIGSIYDPATHEKIAGPRGDDGRFLDETALLEGLATGQGLVPYAQLSSRSAATALPRAGANTTLAVVATNARLRKVDCTKVAQMAHDGLARAINPVHLTRDGDTIFACATGEVDAPLDLIGVFAAEAVAEAIARGVRAANR